VRKSLQLSRHKRKVGIPHTDRAHIKEEAGSRERSSMRSSSGLRPVKREGTGSTAVTQWTVLALMKEKSKNDIFPVVLVLVVLEEEERKTSL
jgi:hypothetical protein